MIALDLESGVEIDSTSQLRPCAVIRTSQHAKEVFEAEHAKHPDEEPTQ